MLILFFYTILVAVCVFGWLSAKKYEVVENQAKTALSLVVCCRNEQEKLPFLLQSIECQIPDIEQVVFANDNSNDGTVKILQSFAKKYSNVIFFSTKGSGKKNALKEAMQFVENEYVITFDADCVVPNNYFLAVKNFLSKNQPDLMIGGVKFVEETILNHCLLSEIEAHTLKNNDIALTRNLVAFFTQIQTLEFASLIAFGAGAALAGLPIMCNGANLAFRKKVWQNAENHLVMQEISGDDMFFLHYVKKNGGKIAFLKMENGFVCTFAAQSVGEFLRQRQRWASKSRSYSDKETIFTAILVFLINFLILFFALGAVFSKFWLNCFLIIFLFKLFIDSILLIPFLVFTKQKQLIKFIPILSVVYPFYIISIAIAGIFCKIKWKT
jgi:cellulose synthase/poly-beta-1,6-N-acetylglucosamine synthase-like glycosyltransferase